MSLLVGGGLAGATIVGVVNNQTAAPSQSPGDSTNPSLVYGQTE
ncbi:hypothetical protein [Nocardioides sp. LMS-CY]|nr:hypothetical protein [Nocardioides sp. LMS-CY]